MSKADGQDIQIAWYSAGFETDNGCHALWRTPDGRLVKATHVASPDHDLSGGDAVRQGPVTEFVKGVVTNRGLYERRLREDKLLATASDESL